jgi:17beta-estradiol 17-dehydrogenase / very-long-chain 3-oxoacyl-CoA reductase
MQIPMYVATNMIRGLKAPLFLIPSPEMYSKASIRWIGYEHVCIPYWIHSVQRFILRGLPGPLLDWCSELVLNIFRKERIKKMKTVKQ